MTNPNRTPLRDLPPDGAIQAIEELLDVARGFGLNVAPTIRPELWAEMFGPYHFDELRAALLAFVRTKGSSWLNTPGEILSRLPDPDEEIWARVEARIASGNLELAQVLDGRGMLAILDDQSIAWDYAHAAHPMERARVRERFLTALRRDRTSDPRIAPLVRVLVDQGMPRPAAVARVLSGPGLDVRESLVPLAQREIEARHREIEAKLHAMAGRLVPARA